MQQPFTRRLLALILSTAAILSQTGSAAHGVEPAPPDDTLRVMSFNIRYGTANDGPNHWEKRRNFLVQTIQAFDPDLLGTQETLGFQKDFIAEKIPCYTPFGVGREDGGAQGEMTAIFFRTSRFEKLGGGHFWLSETPDVVASKSWDSSLPRMVSWVKLKDLQADPKSAAAPVIFFFNTHFDHIGKVARVESARLLRRKITTIAGNAPVILTGDFNAGENSRAYNKLFGAAPDGEVLAILRDAHRVAHPTPGTEETTFNAFDGAKRAGDRIDWIAITQDFDVPSSEIDHTTKDGHPPSDHFPVKAILQRK
jgi:endonuclease/exonuclease/phosphatase family metal-dependent hydrolase